MGVFGWRWDGRERPSFAVEPAEGQESVWDYPRPPRIQSDARRILVRAGAQVVADTSRAVRVLETASPPTFYIPPEDVRMELLRPGSDRSVCEWKGAARTWDVVAGGERLARAAWSYPAPPPAFSEIRDWLSFYPEMLHCSVGGERVRPQGGGFYGGWVTREIVGPWKGGPGSGGW